MFELFQFHFHAPSEHTINGVLYDAELHLVHKNKLSGDLGVIAVFFDRDNNKNLNNTFLKSLELNTTDPLVKEIDLMSFLNKIDTEGHLFSYLGSLTTPPCDEIVTWFIINDPQPISDY
jgi:carbonic anhydrase